MASAAALSPKTGALNLTEDQMRSVLDHVNNALQALREERMSFWLHWREIAEYLLPRRYRFLVIPNKATRGSPINQRIIDETGVVAWRTLSAGMMSGITSPGRPWFRLTVEDQDLADIPAVKLWAAEVVKRMLTVMAESNYYTAKATQYGDLAAFGTAPMLIYEDYEDVIRCYNPAAGEYFVANDNRLKVAKFAREFTYTISQVVQEFGLENCSANVRATYERGKGGLQQEIIIGHVIEQHDDQGAFAGVNLAKGFKWREVYWELGSAGGVLRVKGYYEFPCSCPRWDLVGNDSYGRSPAMDALGSLKQLQVETKAKGVGILKHVDPPLLADLQLKNQPASTLPGRITFVQSVANSGGMKPVYQVAPDLTGLIADIQDVRERIKEVFFVPLFMMISQLDTVRTATEIDARREEKLIQLGPVLERFENESLDPDIDRIFAIMLRANLLPPIPKELSGQTLKVQYISMLAQMQRAASTSAIERFFAFIGSLLGADPGALDNADVDEAIAEYGDLLGVNPKIIRSALKTAQIRAQRAQQQQQMQAVQLTEAGVQGAQTLSQTDVGGGQNALEQILYGAGGRQAA